MKGRRPSALLRLAKTCRCLLPGPSGVLQPTADHDALSALVGNRHVSSDYEAGVREWSEAPEVTAGPSWAIAEAVLNQTHIHSLRRRNLGGTMPRDHDKYERA